MSFKNALALIISSAIIGLMTTSCSLFMKETPPPPPQVEPPAQSDRMPVEKQEELAMQTYQQMLELTAERSRYEVLDQLRDGYYKVINEYPDSFLAEESYLRLILHYLHDYEIPREDDAERLYKEYFEKYPKPRMNNAINDALSRHYYEFGRWEKLAKFTTPFMRAYVKEGKFANTIYLFFYSESKFRLGEYDEARRGFRIIMRLFPDTKEADHAKKRLAEINEHLGLNKK